jgi:D-alanyl-D-alanine dipeptidase
MAISSQSSVLPDGFTYVRDEIPNIIVELRYYSTQNFIGDTIRGYHKPRLILSSKAVRQLHKVQKALNSEGLGLKIFDAYRPQTAVNHFVEWVRVLEDTLMKAQFYPEVEKKQLFKEGYIASKSGHSRGSSIDLTIINLESGEELDMGSPFDFFGKRSWLNYQQISEVQAMNRQLLQKVMNAYGFRSYSKEWWHFTLNNEPFPNTYFDFPVE